ncbi:MAG: MBL fold metallo-hydrolase [Clostridia bacterium]|nr:MBL fold metallo-hydrolase [Clostridia bacterium]
MYSARKKKCFPAVILVILLFVFSTSLAEVHVNEEKPADWDQRELFRITSLNFFQNDVFILECGGKVMLLDGGTQKHWIKYRDFLREHDMTHVDILFNTHPHDDHIGAIYMMLQKGVLTADQFISPFPRSAHEKSKVNLQPKVVALLDKMGIPYVEMHEDEKLQLGGAEMVLYRWDEGKNDNALSGALRIQFGEATILMTADIEGDTERYFMEKYKPEELKVDILKAPHHGVNWIVPEFLEVTDPELTIVTNDNNAKVILQLNNHARPYLYTYRGPMTMETDGKDWYVNQERITNGN